MIAEAWDAAAAACAAQHKGAVDDVRSVSDAAVASVGQSPAEAAAWYVDLCEEAYAKYCATALEPLAAGANGQEHVPGAIHACFAWLCERYAMLGGAEHGGLCLPEAGAPLLLRCQTQFTLAMHGARLEALPAYFGHVLRETHGTILADPSGVQVAAQLRVLGLATLVQGMLTSTATRLLENAVRRETGASTVRLAQTLQYAAFPAMHDMLQHQLMPALTVLLDARPHGLPLADEAPRDVWDVSVSHIHDESMRTVAPAPDHESLYLRLEYGLSRALGHVRLAQLYEIVGMYPRSRAALGDLMVRRRALTQAWLEKSDERVNIAEALKARLLHPGVDTHAILVYYVNIVYALRLVDTSGVILSQVLPPVQRYLRTRPDTIHAVVSALLGDDPSFQLLRMELASAGASLTTSHARAQEDEEAQARPEYWTDPTWAPRPVDAGPEFGQMRSRDVIDLLVSIFDDHAGFIRALEQHTAHQLVRTQDYDTGRVQRNNAIFKRRFGESSLHHCDVMLADIATSAGHDAHFHQACDGALAATPATAVHPLVISRQFWPEIDTRTFTLPIRLADALDAYAQHYARAERKRRVKWLPHLGTVDVEVEMSDGRRIQASVSPLEAAVAELVAGMGVPAEAGAEDAIETDESDGPARPKPRIVTADNVASALEIDRQTAVAALRFWAAHDVLAELAAPASGSFAVQERAIS